MKRIMGKLFISVTGLLAGLMLASCSISVDDSSSSSEKELEYGTLTVKSEESNVFDSLDSRAAVVSSDAIKFAKVVISGDGIESGKEPSSSYVTVINGKVSSVTVPNIPVGKNRIITAYAYESDAENAKISSLVLRLVKDINPGENTAVVTKKTTAVGNTFEALKNLSVKLAGVSVSKIEEYIDTSVNYALINTDQLAKDYKESKLSSKKAADYVVAPGSVELKYYFADGFKVQVGDPCSEVLQNVTAGSKVTVEKVAPGTWPVYLLDA